eukprot:6050662-Prorocentrum_lima.AAC.1
MTSSLVGSEMCIRDSGGRARDAAWTALGVAANERTHTHSHSHPRTHTPVSYTDLTLPTICSV